jgi:hypothetical protein
MPQQPITRHFDYGCTFRWVQGESHIVVKSGYVIEGKSVVVARARRTYEIQDRPGENPHDDERTWLATIPVNASRWPDGRYLVSAVNAWVQQHRNLVNLNSRTGRK